MDLLKCPCVCDSVPEGYLVGIGNPLLDISATVEPDMLTKYGLNANDAIMAEEKHLPLYKELVEKYNASYLAGGSVKNSLRIIQWILKKPNVCTYFGCVGDDDFATVLKEKAISDGVNVLYQVDKEEPTGTCAVLLTSGGTRRSLCANLGAARKFTPDHLEKPECKKAIQNAKIFYASGFFVAVSPESVMKLAKHAHENNLRFCFNVSAAFVMEHFKPQLDELLPYIDYLFGNTDETMSFANAFGMKGSIEEIGFQMAALPKLNKERPRVVIITQSHDPVIVIQNDEIFKVPVTPLTAEEIVDTNCAGDAFTGGFLSQLIQDKPLKQCVQCGIYTANQVIRVSGCSLTGESNFQVPE